MDLSMGEAGPENLQLESHPQVEYTLDISTYMSSVAVSLFQR